MTDRPPDRPFTPIRPNPYIVGNPVRGRSMFFGREAEFELVRRRFQESTHGGLLVFCGERRSGKTSILFQILDRRLGPDFIPVLIDMQSMAVGSEAEFLTRISEEVFAAFGTDAAGIERPNFLSESNRAAVFQRFIRDILRVHPQKKLILLFDEYELFENKIDSGLLAEDVLYILASLIESQSVFVIFTGSQHLEQRRAEYWKILGKSIYKTVSYLEREDALNLIRAPVEGRVLYATDAVEAIHRLAAGQAFYTQAICQSLVDRLNEQRTCDASRERVAEVADGIINNPLPQMIFLWDALERDEKLVLALLAECLADDGAHAGVDPLLRMLRQREYPLDLDRVRAATTLEKLYKTEMLLRSDRASAAEYAFRMDLWRLWIRRQHSVWQVMREEGLEIRRSPRWRRWIPVGTIAVVVLAVAIALPGWLQGRRGTAPASFPASAGPTGFVVLEADPANATIHLNGRLMSLGSLRELLAAGVEHHFQLAAPGFADTMIVIQAAAGDTTRRRAALRALLGDLRIETRPLAADIRVDGRAVGTSPLTVHDLGVAKPHRVEATMAGHGMAQADVTLQPGRLVTSALVLETGKVDVLVTTDPTASEIRVDGTVRGTSPLPISALSLGRHSFAAAREGHSVAETTLVVGAGTRQIQLVLAQEPPGVLVVQGDYPGQIYIDGALVVENVQNSGPRSLPAGPHQVRVVLVSGDVVDHAVTLRSGERSIFDFTKGTVTRKPEGVR